MLANTLIENIFFVKLTDPRYVYCLPYIFIENLNVSPVFLQRILELIEHSYHPKQSQHDFDINNTSAEKKCFQKHKKVNTRCG